MPCDGSRLDETGIGDNETGRERDELFGPHEGTIGESTIGEDAQIRVLTDAALGGTDRTLGARSTPLRGLDRIRDAVDDARELMAVGEATRAHAHEPDIGAADARRHDVEQHAITVRFVDLDDPKGSVDVSGRAHGSGVDDQASAGRISLRSRSICFQPSSIGMPPQSGCIENTAASPIALASSTASAGVMIR